MHPIIRHGIIPASASKYHPFSNAYFAEMSVQLSTARKKAVDTFVRGLVSNSLWNSFDFLYIHALPESQQSRLNLISPTDTEATITGTPTFTAEEGWSSGAIANRLEAPYDLDTMSKFTQNSAHIGHWLANLVNDNAFICGSSDTRSVINPFNGGDMLGRITQTTQWNGGASGSSGHFVFNRSASTAAQAYYNGTSGGTNTQASSAITAGSRFRICNTGVGGTIPNLGTVRLTHLGSSLSSGQASTLNTLISALITALDAA